MVSMEEIRKWVKEYVAGILATHYFRRSLYRQVSGGAASAHQPIILDPDGKIDNSFLDSTTNDEWVADTVGAMLTGNTETGITVTYQDADNTIDFVVAAQDHGALTGLADDDHTQYHNDARGDVRYAPIAKGVTNGDSHDHVGGDGGQIDHGSLTGLADDDHTQYYNDARGDARYGRLASANTWASTNKFDNDITISAGGTQDYEIGDDGGTSLVIRGLSAGQGANIRIYSFDGDATDTSYLQIWGRGTEGQITNRERLLVGWNSATSAYEIQSEADGTGTLRPLVLYTEGNTNQLRLNTDGTVSVVSTLTATGINVGEDTLTIFNDAVSSWTPTITADTTSPTYTATATGRYRRVNNLYTYQGRIAITTVTAAGTGDLRFSLPATGTASLPQSHTAYLANVAGVSRDPASGFNNASTAYCYIVGATGGIVTAGDLTAGTSVILYSGSFYA